MIRAIRFIRSTTRKEREDAFEGWWAVFVVVGWFVGAWIATPANAYGTALSPYGSSPQAVLPVPASIAFAGDAQ